MANDLQRLARFVQISRQGCWEWTGNSDKNGYGRFGWGGMTWLAHRAAYTLHVGPIPLGMCLDHRCRNKACCNPWHLDLITRGENILRGISFSACNARKTRCAHGHDFDARNTYLHRGRRQCRSCNRAAVARYKQRQQVPEVLFGKLSTIHQGDGPQTD